MSRTLDLHPLYEQAGLAELGEIRSKVVASGDTKFRPDGDKLTVKQGRSTFDVTPRVMDQLANITPMPSSYMKRCDAELLATNLNHWIPTLGTLRLNTKGGELIALGNPRVPAVHPERVGAKLASVVGDQCKLDRAHGSLDWIDLYVVGAKRDHVKKGDWVEAGLHVGFSPIGIANPLAEGYVRRLVCTNGATVHKGVYVFKYGDGDGGEDDGVSSTSVWQWFNTAMKEAYKSFPKEIGRLRDMTKQRVNPSQVVAQVTQGLPRNAARLIEARMMDESPRTMYDVYNIITYVASHNIDNPNIVNNMFHRAGQLDSDHRNCPVCRRRVS